MKSFFSNFKKIVLSICKLEQKHFFINEVRNNYFVLRHGHTDYTANLTDVIYPASTRFELGITEQGEGDVYKLIPLLREKKIDLIFASDYLRTQITSRIVAEGLDLDVVSDKRLRDVDLGIYEGRKKKEYYDKITPRIMFEKGVEGGESWADCAKRMEDFVGSTERQYQGKNILVVSHTDPLWLLERGIARKDNIDKLLEERYSVPTIKPGELRGIDFK